MAKNFLIILLIIIIIIAALIFGASLYVNKMIEDTLHDELRSTLSANGLGDYISYDEIDVQVLTGEVALKKLSISDAAGGLDIKAYEVFVRISPAEAVAFARNPDTAILTGASAGAAEVQLNSKENDDSIEIDNVDLMLEGRFNQKLLEDNEAVINDIDINLYNTGIDFPKLGIYAGVKKFSGSFSGTMNPTELNTSVSAFLGQQNRLKVDLDNADIELNETLRSSTALFFGAASADKIVDTMHIEKIYLDINSEINKIDVNKLDLVSDGLAAAGTAEIALGDDTTSPTLDSKLEIHQMAEGVRSIVEPYLSCTEQVLPGKTPFTVNASIAEDGSVFMIAE
ncbi:MAG: hypothetical protein PQJ61_02795 [Spirochaetales bacterium]|uniref:Uncharacterized protein n=1 Tax=Candidatus Thalassospirochaeta sargassi TaxID=3119039 RepID=A0AAJ1IAK1_9SPIO|nr:hypothetical protein [Spirochaetales bacterium]